MTAIKRSQEYGWTYISRAEYDRLCKHQYAGPELGGTAWVLTPDENGGTCLWTGVTIEDFPPKP